ncbi:MAG: transcriptional regulator TrmB [Parcubacteria group bacterium]|nr:transcriptional regulator TrmB [Parcubacteria group bacterium]
MFEKYLEDSGLSDKEASIYLALLTFENASALDLAKKTGIKRPTVYTAIETLARKGLVSETTVGKKTNYYAESPDRLETLVEQKKLILEETQKALHDIVPQLKSLVRQSGEKPVVKYFEGKEGIFSSNDEILRSLSDDAEPIYAIYSKDLIEQTFTKEELQKFKDKRVSKSIKSLGIYTSEGEARSSDSMAERLRIDEKAYPLTCDITIYKDIVLLSILGKRVSAILIKNKDVADTMKSLFKVVYDNKKS